MDVAHLAIANQIWETVMPGVSNFSTSELADRLFAAVQAEAAAVRILKDAVERIAGFGEDDQGMDGDDIALECVSIAKYALKCLDG